MEIFWRVNCLLFFLDPIGANCDGSDDSSGDEASPDKSSSFSLQSEKDDRDVIKAEAKKERKRLKREEKEKRREERRKKKMLRTQEMEVDIVEGKVTVEKTSGNTFSSFRP